MKTFSFVILVFLSLFNAISHSQSKFIINVTVGYDNPFGDFKQPLSTSTEDFPYMMKNGMNIQIAGKLAIGKKGNLRAVFGAGYNTFYSNGVTTAGEFTPRVNIAAFSLGGEYAFSRLKKISTFIGLDFTANIFTGSFDLPGNPHTQLKSETRFGIQPGGGVNFMFGESVGAVLGLKYHIVNLIGANSHSQSEIAANEVQLGDKAHTLANGTTSSNKSISYLQVYLGAAFYLGTPKKMTKK